MRGDIEIEVEVEIEVEIDELLCQMTYPGARDSLFDVTHPHSRTSERQPRRPSRITRM